MSRFLVAAAIGPVQDFIAAARRTRDLWLGSQLLSELAKAMALQARAGGAELIFPAPENRADLEPGSRLSVANKLLCVPETESPGQFCDELRQAVTKQLRDFGEAALEKIKKKKMAVDESAFTSQLNSFLEFYAAWLPLPAGHAAYAPTRRQLEKLLAGRKTLRNFAQHQGSSAPKNTIDGIREDIITRRDGDAGFDLKAGERLDAIGLLKRFGQLQGRQPRFDSTHDISAVPHARRFLQLARRDKKTDAWLKEFCGLVPNDAAPRAFLPEFEGRRLGLLLAPESDGEAEEDPRLAHLRRKIHGKMRPNPPYYCLLKADGDQMGQCLDQCQSMAEHQEFSRKLAGFAQRAKEAVGARQAGESPLGEVIYAGGDDFLAFVPLDTALDAAKAVHQAFRESGLPHPASLSIGLVIAHAQEDLTAVVESAEAALKVAKNKYGRDALAIQVRRRGGVPFIAGGKWDSFPGELRQIIQAYEAQEVPFGLGYEWRELAERCRRAQVPGGIVGSMAAAVLDKKSASAGLRLRPLTARIQSADDLRNLADLLVLAKAFFSPPVQESAPDTSAEETTA